MNYLACVPIALVLAGCTGVANVTNVSTNSAATSVVAGSSFDGIYFGSAKASGGSACTAGTVTYGKSVSIKGGSGIWTISSSSTTFKIAGDGSINFGVLDNRFSGQASSDGISLSAIGPGCTNYFSFSRFAPQSASRPAGSQYDGTYQGVARLDTSLPTRPDCQAEVSGRRLTISNGIAVWNLNASDSMNMTVGDDGHFGAIGGKYYLKGDISGPRLTIHNLQSNECPYIFDLQRS